MEIEYKKSVIHQTVGGGDMETEVMLPDFGDEQEQCPIGIWGECVPDIETLAGICDVFGVSADYLLGRK